MRPSPTTSPTHPPPCSTPSSAPSRPSPPSSPTTHPTPSPPPPHQPNRPPRRSSSTCRSKNSTAAAPRKSKSPANASTTTPATDTTTATTATATQPSYVVDERLLAVTVLPGYPAGTRITFAGEGDQHATATPALYGDVAFVVADRPHPLYRRVGEADLLYVHRLPLVEALCGSVVELRVLDDRLVSVALSDVCRPGGRKVVRGEGMPRVVGRGGGAEAGGRGDLLIEFEVEFPDQLTLGQKDGIRQLLS